MATATMSSAAPSNETAVSQDSIAIQDQGQAQNVSMTPQGPLSAQNQSDVDRAYIMNPSTTLKGQVVNNTINSQDPTPSNTTVAGDGQTGPTITIPPSFDKFVPVPCTEPPKPEQPIIMQNNGFCLSAMQNNGALSVNVTPVADVSEIMQKQAWSIRSNGAIMHKEFNKCLFREQEGGLGLCGCDESQVSSFDIDYATGLFRDRNSKQILSMDNTSVMFKEEAEAEAENNQLSQAAAKWTAYSLLPRSEFKEPSLIKVRPRDSDLVSIQQLGMFLVAQLNEQQDLSLGVTKQPPALQFQSWMFLQNGQIKNTQFNQCLSVQQSSLVFAPCDAQDTSVWEFVQDSGVLREQRLNQCLSLEGNTVALKEYSKNSVSAQQKWEAYAASRLTSAGNNGSISPATIMRWDMSMSTLGMIALLRAIF
jgi:hypothetical protein